MSAKKRQEISNNEHQVTNRGFRVNPSNPTGGLQRYVQNKVGVTSKYDKRHLLENEYGFVVTYPIKRERE